MNLLVKVTKFTGDWDDIFKVMKEKKNCQPSVFDLIKLSLRDNDKIKAVPDNRSRGSSSLLDLSYKKCQMEFFQLEENENIFKHKPHW